MAGSFCESRKPWIFSLLALAAFACSAEGRDVASSGAQADGGAPGPSPSSSTAPGPNIQGSDASTAKPEPKSVVYGHSGQELYRLDPNTKGVTLIGAFENCGTQGGIIDIALDQSSNLYGATLQALYKIDPDTATCTKIASGDYPNSLSFVPQGTVDPNEEALVGYDLDQYIRIDTSTGKRTVIGEIGSGYESSGDIVSVKDGGTYLTVKGNGCADCIVEVNPATGKLVRKLGSLGHKDVFGLAYWAGSAYGFDKTGNLFEVDLTGTKVTTTAITIPKKPADLSFWGAGSTTSAPVGSVK